MTHPFLRNTVLTPFVARLLLSLTAVTLVACGGGGGTRGPATCQPGVSTMAFPNGCPDDAVNVAGTSSLAITLTDAAGATVHQVTPDQASTVRASVKDARGAALPNVAVTFTTTDATGTFVPSTGTALTDASGVARVGLPAGRRAGAFTLTASAVVAGAATKASVDYAVSFPTLTLGPLLITPSTLSAGGNASVATAVLRGGAPYLPPLGVSFTSPCIITGKASMGPPVLTQNGVASTSYTDKGCGVADVITASVTLGDATATQAGTITVLPASAGSIKFLTADTTNISLRGTGGFGRQEFATLKFEVSDRTGSKVPGVLVDFVFADSGTTQTVGGLTLNPSFATSAADGTVTTLVTGGTIPTSVRVIASLRDKQPPITTLSDTLVVSTGIPDQRHFSLATSIGNCEGRDFDQLCSIVTATLGDHFGNPVPDGTAVNFSSEGGVIGASCVTGSLPLPGATPAGQTTNSRVGPGSGSCSVELRSASPRQANGRITVLAYALGEEDFNDTNGNNVYDRGEPFTDKRADIFRNDDESGVSTANPDGTWTSAEPCIGPNVADATGARTCSTPAEAVPQYNGVLRQPQVPSPQNLYVTSQFVQLFSGSNAVITINPTSLVCPASGTVDALVTVKDVAGNLMPAGTRITFSAALAFSNAVPIVPSEVKVNNVALALAEPVTVPTYTVTISCGGRGGGKFFVTVTTPNGVETIGNVPVN
jgi:hypothetical protein